jgi:hypothetical protein
MITRALYFAAILALAVAESEPVAADKVASNDDDKFDGKWSGLIEHHDLADTDRDGKVTVTELAAHVMTLRLQHPSTEKDTARYEHPENFFRNADSDKNGKITETEFVNDKMESIKHVFEDPDRWHPEDIVASAKAEFVGADTNGDSSLDMAEFKILSNQVLLDATALLNHADLDGDGELELHEVKDLQEEMVPESIARDIKLWADNKKKEL